MHQSYSSRPRRRLLVVTSLVLVAIGGFAYVGSRRATAATTGRDRKRWPFAWNSIWNMPIGSGASYVPANIPAPMASGVTVDEDIIVMTPDAPPMSVRHHEAGWNWGVSRCANGAGGAVVMSLPIPGSFVTGQGLGATPNMPAAVLTGDGRTVHQSQPFHTCGGYAVTQYVYPSVLIDGDGIEGAHGGSGLSSLGGALRVGELRPASGPVRHALKLNLDMQQYGGCANDGTPCYRWPAVQADSSATGGCNQANVHGGGYCGRNTAFEMGSLLALPPGFDVSSLSTEPARRLAAAFRDYGAYVADSTGWDVFGLMTEWGPDGRFVDQFSADWGISFETGTLSTCSTTSSDCQWSKDLSRIMTSLAIVDNNGPGSIGGPGTRIAPCAPAFEDGTGGAPAGCGPAGSDSDPGVTPTTAAPTTTGGAPSTTVNAPTTTSPDIVLPPPSSQPTTTRIAVTLPPVIAVTPGRVRPVVSEPTTTTPVPSTTEPITATPPPNMAVSVAVGPGIDTAAAVPVSAVQASPAPDPAPTTAAPSPSTTSPSTTSPSTTSPSTTSPSTTSPSTVTTRRTSSPRRARRSRNAPRRQQVSVTRTRRTTG
jgi:hypothetical protein